MRVLSMCVAVLALGMGGVGVSGQTGPAQHSDDPLDQCWSTYKVGSWATLSSDTTSYVGSVAVAHHQEMTSTVQAISADAVTMKVSVVGTEVAKNNGAKREDRPSSMEIVTKRHDSHPPLEYVGEDDVAAAGRTFHTQVYAMQSVGLRYYMSTDVPGCTVKMEMPAIGKNPPEVKLLTAFGWQ